MRNRPCHLLAILSVAACATTKEPFQDDDDETSSSIGTGFLHDDEDNFVEAETDTGADSADEEDNGSADAGANDDSDSNTNDSGAGDGVDPSEEWPWPGEFISDGVLSMEAAVGDSPVSTSCTGMVPLTVDLEGQVRGEFECTLDLMGYASFDVSHSIEAIVVNEHGDVEGSISVSIPFVGYDLPYSLVGTHTYSESVLTWEGSTSDFMELSGTIVSDRSDTSASD